MKSQIALYRQRMDYIGVKCGGEANGKDRVYAEANRVDYYWKFWFVPEVSEETDQN